jgi:putative membrane protein
MMIADHSALRNRIAPLAPGEGSDLTTASLQPYHQQLVDSLRNAGSGPAFDKAYLQAQSETHQECLKYYQAYAARGETAQLRDLAREATRNFEQHLNHLSDTLR